MTTSTLARVPDARAGKQTSDHPRMSLNSRIEALALRERDAVRRKDWSAARVAAEEKAALQAARQSDLARRLV